LNVGGTKDFPLTHSKFRAFTPEGVAPPIGWPVLLYFHGGQLTWLPAYHASLALIT
jgi:hypothetical protein